MSKRLYVMPLLSRIAIFVADRLPERIRVSVYIDALESLDGEYKHIETVHTDDGYSLFDAVKAVRIATLRDKAIREGLHGKIGDRKR